MWKLFQSVFKTFRQQIPFPYNRISTPPQDSASTNGTKQDEDGNCENSSQVAGDGCLARENVSNNAPVVFPVISCPPDRLLSQASSRADHNQNIRLSSKTLPFTLTFLQFPSSSLVNVKSNQNFNSVDSEESLKVKPTMASLHHAMGLSALKNNNRDVALQHLAIAADAYGSSKANYNLGVINQFQLKNNAEAARRYRLAPDHPDALFNLAFLTLRCPDATILMPKAAREKEALKLLKKAASAGSKEAADFLALHYHYPRKENVEISSPTACINTDNYNSQKFLSINTTALV